MIIIVANKPKKTIEERGRATRFKAGPKQVEIARKGGLALKDNPNVKVAARIRELKKKGLILEPDFKLADFKSKIYSYLEDYEKHFKKKLKTRGKYFTKGKKFKRIELP